MSKPNKELPELPDMAQAAGKPELPQAAEDAGAQPCVEPRVRIKIPVDPLNKEDSFIPVGINGYIYQIKRGVAVEVPQTVAGILEDAKYI